jgi:hypothetical protein
MLRGFLALSCYSRSAVRPEELRQLNDTLRRTARHGSSPHAQRWTLCLKSSDGGAFRTGAAAASGAG